ncbi:XRE family transcriptional regulator [Streptomyces sp. NPDC012421]|uniref:XRE family transcriptional regulator n=1 Tax=Streptomyces sp. NPDC012421 TaxID=3364832 RepID=UPI0036EAD81F
MTPVEHLGESSPYEARDAAGFVESLQRLKARSRLTYRELEEKAARNGDVLARSTLADTLRRTSLPRPDVLAAFVRACGEGERVADWLNARERIADGVGAGSSESVDAADSEPSEATEPAGASGLGPESPGGGEEAHGSRPRRVTGRTALLLAALVVPLSAWAAWALLGDGGDEQRPPAAGVGAGPAPADGWVTIRPARTPDLCLTDGRVRDRTYPSAVAVQLPCDLVTVPRTFLEPAGERLYRIQWHHPQEGKGCLTVMGAGPAKGLLEPRQDCARATLFRLESTGGDGSAGFRLRPADGSRCIGIVGDDTADGAEAAEERCADGADQRFLVRKD